jgi:hypothetical protein
MVLGWSAVSNDSCKVRSLWIRIRKSNQLMNNNDLSVHFPFDNFDTEPQYFFLIFSKKITEEELQELFPDGDRLCIYFLFCLFFEAFFEASVLCTAL